METTESSGRTPSSRRGDAKESRQRSDWPAEVRAEAKLQSEERTPEASVTAALPSETQALINEAQRIFARQRENHWRIARTTAAERIRKLRRLHDAVLRHREAICTAMYADFRKPPIETELSEIQPTIAELRHAMRHLRRWMRPRRVRTPLVLAGARSEVRYEPKGVVLIMAPWNYPFALILVPLVAAVAAGNCVMLRPSEKVPRTAALLTRLIRETFDEGEVACLDEPGTTLATALLELPFDHVFFTGSTRVGRLVMTAAAKHLAGITLELGGKSPLIVDETADITSAAERTAWGKLINAGQTCIAPDYALVHESVRQPFVDALRASIVHAYGKHPEDRQATRDYARAIDHAAYTRLTRLLDASVAAGATIAVGGETDAVERYIAPTVLTDVTWDSPIMGEEIFGPILPVLTYRDLDEVLTILETGDKPLALYIFSRSRAAIDSIIARSASGAVAVNNVVLHYINVNLPFGGVGASGVGAYHGWYGFRTFSHERAVMTQRFGNPARLLFPPYTKRTERLLRVLERLL